MLLAEADIITRVESPLNLLNRLRKETSVRGVGRSSSRTEIVSLPNNKPIISAADIIPNLDDKLNAADSKGKALSIMNKCLSRLETNVEALDPRKLPSVIKEMSTVVKNLEPEKEKEDNKTQFIIYSPITVEESTFEVINVKD